MSRSKVNILLFVVLIILVTILISSVSTLDTNSTNYSIKRFRESFLLKLSISPNSKAEGLTDQLNERLKEIKFLVDSGNQDPLEKASNRYNSIAGQLIDILPNLNDAEVKRIKEKLKNHPQVLADLKSKFGSQSAYTLILPQNIDTANRILAQ